MIATSLRHEMLRGFRRVAKEMNIEDATRSGIRPHTDSRLLPAHKSARPESGDRQFAAASSTTAAASDSAQAAAEDCHAVISTACGRRPPTSLRASRGANDYWAIETRFPAKSFNDAYRKKPGTPSDAYGALASQAATAPRRREKGGLERYGRGDRRHGGVKYKPTGRAVFRNATTGVQSVLVSIEAAGRKTTASGHFRRYTPSPGRECSAPARARAQANRHYSVMHGIVPGITMRARTSPNGWPDKPGPCR